MTTILMQAHNDYHHITQSIQDLTDSTQQNTLHSMEENTLSFTDDTDTHCDFNITDHFLDTENANDIHTCTIPVPRNCAVFMSCTCTKPK